MYAIHTTQGFIIDSRPWGDAGKTISIFTRELGLVSATAQGIRLEKSKLRYHAQDYSLGIFALVKGKEFWRLTSAQPDELFSSEGRAYAYLSSRLAALLKRAIPGQEPHADLYDIVKSCLRFARTNEDLDRERLQTLESIAVFLALRALGYVASSIDLSSITIPVSAADLDAASTLRISMNRHINPALRESHL